jgi:hypothetical protein
MHRRHTRAGHAWIVEVLGILIMSTILIAGLWPFHSPKNEVAWLENENGVHFGHHGSMVSSSALPASVREEDGSSSIEMWLKPEQLNGTNTILAFEGSGNPRVSFSVQQYLSGLVALHCIVSGQGSTRESTFGVKGVFRREEPVFVTLTSGTQNTLLYVNGVQIDGSRTFRISSKDLTGKVVLANSTRNSSWSGKLLGLAIYHQQLTQLQVMQHYASWTRNQSPATAGADDRLSALYLFNEGKGNIAHDQLGRAPDLTIPEHFFVLHPLWFEFPGHDYRASWSYWKDVAVNVAGFIPLGFVFAVYFSAIRRVPWPVATTVAAGFFISFAIEALQVFLPTRSSSITDVITNTLGTTIGALPLSYSIVQRSLIGLVRHDGSRPLNFRLVSERNTGVQH